jgi:hypothetical protein
MMMLQQIEKLTLLQLLQVELDQSSKNLQRKI